MLWLCFPKTSEHTRKTVSRMTILCIYIWKVTQVGYMVKELRLFISTTKTSLLSLLTTTLISFTYFNYHLNSLASSVTIIYRPLHRTNLMYFIPKIFTAYFALLNRDSIEHTKNKHFFTTTLDWSFDVEKNIYPWKQTLIQKGTLQLLQGRSTWYVLSSFEYCIYNTRSYFCVTFGYIRLL